MVATLTDQAERLIALSLAHASLLKGAAQVGLMYAEKHGGPHEFAALKEAIGEVRRQFARGAASVTA